MLILNLSHPLTPTRRAHLAEITGEKITGTCDLPAQLDHAKPFPAKIRSLVYSIGLTPE